MVLLCELRKIFGIRTRLCRHLHPHSRWHAACILPPRRQCRRSSIRPITTCQLRLPAIPRAVGSCRTSSEGEASPVPSRSPTSRWNQTRSCHHSTTAPSWTRSLPRDAWTRSSRLWKWPEWMPEWESWGLSSCSPLRNLSDDWIHRQHIGVDHKAYIPPPGWTKVLHCWENY